MKLQAYLTIAGLVLAQSIQAALIYGENFDSLTAGALNGQGGWTANIAGTMNVVANPAVALSSPNYMTLGGGGAVQHNFAATDLSTQATSLDFYFLATTTTAGRNIQLSMREATSGSASVFYLNLLGAGTGIQVGTGPSSVTSYTFSSALSTNTWYHFSATTNPLSESLTFNVAPAAGGAALTSGVVDLSGTGLTTSRMVFLSNASTVGGDWAMDNISFSAVPEPGAAAILLGSLGLLVLRRRAFARRIR